MNIGPLRLGESLGFASRVVHGSMLTAAIDRALGRLGRISPQLSYSLRTSLAEAIFPLRPSRMDTPPTLRGDFGRYADLYRNATINFERVVSHFQAEIRWPRARVFNRWFETIDAELYYCMIRFFKSRKVVEIGAGNSTWFARDALRANGTGELWAIDPAPRTVLPRQCHQDRRSVLDVEASFFRNLGEADVLFIDASHKEYEAEYITGRIYPVLRPGVFIHHHDILFPYVGYTSTGTDWEQSGEQKAVLDFLRNHRDSFEVFTSSAFAWYESPDIVSRLIPSKRYAPERAGGSLWIRKF